MGSLRKNATLNIIKEICTIVFPLITFPYATRILHAQNYGMFTFASSIISYFALVAVLGIDNYAVREGARIRDNNNKINEFSNQIFTINVFSTILAFALLGILIVVWRRIDSYIGIIIVLSIGILYKTIGTDWINVIFEDYTYITIRYVICQSIAIVFLFILVRDQGDVILYAVVTVIGGLIANVANVFYIRNKYKLRLKIALGRKTWGHLIPIIVLFANTIAVTIYINSDATILGIIKNDRAVGIYGVASRIYVMVKQVANAAIYVVIPRIASLIVNDKKQEIRNIYETTINNVLIILIPAMAGLACLSKEIVLLVSGSEYVSASQPLMILSFSLVFASMACFYINGILIPYRKEKVALLLTTVSALVNIGLNIIFIPSFSYNAAAFTTLLSEILICICGIVYTRNICKIRIERGLYLGIVSGIIVFVICIIVKMFIEQYTLIILVCLVLSLSFYLILMCAVKDNFIYEIFQKSIKKLRSELHKRGL